MLEDGDDAVHAFDEFADLGGVHSFAGGHLAEPKFGGFAAVLGLGDPLGDALAGRCLECCLWVPETPSWLVMRRFGIC